MPGDEGDAERFAAADEQGRPPGFVADPGLAHDMEIAAMLRLQGAALAPRDDERARVRARVLAEIARRGDGSRVSGVSATVPFGRLLRPAFPTVSAPATPAWAESLFAAPTVVPVDDPWGHATASTQRLHSVTDSTRTQSELDRPKSGTRRVGGGRREVGTTVGIPPVGVAPVGNAPVGNAPVGSPSVGATLPPAGAMPTVPAATGSNASGSTPGGSMTAVPAPDRRGRRPRHGRSNRPAGRAGAGTARGPMRRRVMAGATAVLAVLAVAGSVFASRDALPGDSLYGVKRVAESVGDALTVGDAARARRSLESATARMAEVQTLVTRDPTTTDPALVQSAIQDFDTSTGAGSRALLTSQDEGGPVELATLGGWASDEATELSALRADLPPTAQPAAAGTLALLDRLRIRTAALAARASCTNQTSGAVDDLGPLPATGACASRAAPAGTRPPAAPGESPSTVPTATPAAPRSVSDPDGSTTTSGAPRSTTDGQPVGGGSSTAPGTGADSATPTRTHGSRTPGLPLNIPLPKVSVPPLPGFRGITVG